MLSLYVLGPILYQKVINRNVAGKNQYNGGVKLDIQGTVKNKMADFCKDLCPACKSARKNQEGTAYKIVIKVEDMCPACKAYKDVYGKAAHEPLT